jgi:hypothetical protein
MTEALLTFLVPVRHPKNAKNWQLLKSNLAQTAQSIAAQTDPRWRAIVVANREADLPDFPDGFAVIRVDFPPNLQYDLGSAALDDVYEAVRFDKGRRILAGLMEVKPQGHIMLVDDDDLVSNRLTEFVAQNSASNGWFIENGYLWSEGGRLLLKCKNFSGLCGTSHIVRSDLYIIPHKVDDNAEAYAKRIFGSHIMIEKYLRDSGTPLAPLPFHGAIYRVGHAGAHSQSSSILKTILGEGVLKRPRRAIRQLLSVRWLTTPLRREFFGVIF